ncbi:hypothetical protein [Microvirga makkahensis]|uniref:hypothetical protein n=1 Tax=Microvirga makkahensis TaxID=1128670 RepID=UPI00197B80C5|nr:hypothetical protein [Microvirga makkahensis]
MDVSFWLPLIMKMLTSAAIVVAASLVVERSGPFVGAMIATLPISAGPAYAFLALDHGSDFISASALAGLKVSAATVVYMLVYAAAAQRMGVLASVGSALAVWAVSISVILKGQWSFGGALALNGAVYAVAIPLARKFSAAGMPVSAKKRAWDIPFRAALVMLVVGVTVVAGRTLGPSIAAAAALAPVVLMSLALILHPRVGGAATASVVANGVPGMIGFVGALSLLHLCAVRLGAALSLILALGVSIGWNASLMAARRWRLLGRVGV